MGFFKAKNLIQAYSALYIGMPEEELLQIAGPPTGQRMQNDVKTMTWKNSEFKGYARGGHITRTLIVDIKDGFVTGFDADNMDRSRW